jgi:hypothetical protein
MQKTTPISRCALTCPYKHSRWFTAHLIQGLPHYSGGTDENLVLVHWLWPHQGDARLVY